MTVIDLAKFELLWEDAFDGNALDSSKWADIALGARKLGYNVSDAITVSNGTLKNTVYKNELGQYCSGMIATAGKFLQNKGYFEARIKMPNIYGIQPAFWLQSPTYGSIIGDPQDSGMELDIIEYVKTSPDKANYTIHWDGYGVDHRQNASSVQALGIADGNFHNFGMEWNDDGYFFYFDGKLMHYKLAPSVPISNVPQYMILSCEIGSWGGDITTQDAYLPAVMEVEWVRVYQKKTN